MKKIIKYGLILAFCFILGSIFSSIFIGNIRAETNFSENLENENYTPETTIDSGWYDGIETFWYDTVGTNPIEWRVNEPSGCTAIVVSEESHTNTLRLYDGSASTYPQAFYYFQESDLTNDYDLMEITFLALQTHTTIWSAIYIYLNNSDYIRFEFKNNAKLGLYNVDTGLSLESTSSYSAKTWYYLRIGLVYYPSGYPSGEGLYNWVRVYTLTGSGLSLFHDFQLRSFTDEIDWEFVDFLYIQTYGSHVGYSVYFDALNYMIQSTAKPITPLSTQIQNIVVKESWSLLSNIWLLNNNLVFSLYNSIISEKADSDNNYRNYFITDNFINVDLLNSSRIMRLVGSNSADKKYKVIQMYFNDLNESDSWMDGNNQSIYVRVDSFDNSNYLINKLHFNLDFNQTDGYIWWNWYERESITIPRFTYKTHNPTFKFSDYLHGQELLEMEVDFHFFLTYNSTHMLLGIRTEIAFNSNYSALYSYDKIISLGLKSEFYGNQDSLKVRYIDYFNRNNGSDYLGFREYTYNNLAGVRTLQVNNTNFFYNFLDVGFFSSVLTYYVNPEPIPPTPPISPEQPAGFDFYWLYNSYELTIETIESDIGNWTVNFTRLHSSPFSVKFWFNYDTIAYLTIEGLKSSMGDWGWNNWLRDGLAVVVMVLANPFIFIFNMILLAGQFILYGLYVSFNFMIMYLVVGLLFCEVIWNFAFYWIFIGIIALGWSIYYGLIWLFYEGLEGLVIFLATIFSWLITLFLWLFTLCTANFNDLFNVVNTAIQELSLFSVELFREVATNMITFLMFIQIYTTITFLILYKHYISKAKGNTNRAIALQQAYEFFLKPLQALYNLIIKIKDFIIGWL